MQDKNHLQVADRHLGSGSPRRVSKAGGRERNEERRDNIAASLLLALAVRPAPSSVSRRSVRLALERKDYAALPVTADNTNTNTRAQLARVNYMRDEPSGRRFFVNDLNGPLYILDKQKKTEEQKANRGSRRISPTASGNIHWLETDGEILRGHQARRSADNDGRLRRAHTGCRHLGHRQLPAHACGRGSREPRIAVTSSRSVRRRPLRFAGWHVASQQLVDCGVCASSAGTTAGWAYTSTGDLPWPPEEQAKADEQSEATIRAVCVNCHPLESIRSRTACTGGVEYGYGEGPRWARARPTSSSG